MLRLVPPPAAAGQDPPARRKRSHSPALNLTAEEARHLRAALRNVARSYGGERGLARVLTMNPSSMRRPSARVAVALWRLSGMSMDTILRGPLAPVPAPTTPTTAGGTA